MQVSPKIKAILPRVAAMGCVIGIYLLIITAPGGEVFFLNPAIDAWHQFQQQWNLVSSLYSISR